MNHFHFISKYLNKHIVLLGVLYLFSIAVLTQSQPKRLREKILKDQSKQTQKPKNKAKKSPNIFKPLAPIVNPLANKNATLVYVENSDTLSFNKDLNPDVQVLRGNVKFRHDNTILFCDSAYFYQKANSMDAFSNIRMVQGDTLFVYGDYLFYDGNTKLARLRRNVRLENRTTTLTTDSLNYDRISNLAYYYTGGKIVDKLNVLTSTWGQYSTTTSDAVFKDKVHLKNENFTLDADSLRYNTNTNIANLIGQTHILYKEETNIYSNKGWYNTSTQQSMLLNRTNIIHKDGKSMTGDTIFYDKKQKYGEGYTNVILTDSIRKVSLYGDYVSYNEISEIGLGSDSALFVDWSSKDTMYVHADTLRTSKDSIHNVVNGFYGVRFYRNDVQGLCDSLAYSGRDSIINLYHEPVLWAEENQLSGDFIQVFTKNQKVEHIEIQKAAMAVQQIDSIHFNQLSGKEIIAYLDSGQLKRVNVNGNAETIYYPIDDADSTMIGLNKTQSSFVVMYLKNKKIDRIVMTSATTGIMYPLGQLTGGDTYLKNYFWLDQQRPKNKSDVFLYFKKEERKKIGTSSLMNVGSSSPNKQPNTN